MTLSTPAKHEVLLNGARLPQMKADQVGVPLGGQGDLVIAVARQSQAGQRRSLVLAPTSTEVHVTPSQADWHETVSVEL